MTLPSVVEYIWIITKMLISSQKQCNDDEYTNPKDFWFQAIYLKCFPNKVVAPKERIENSNTSKKSPKVNNLTHFFEILWDISAMLVDLFRLSLRYWMPAMNPFILSSKLSSIIMGLYFSTVDQIGEAKVHVAYQLVNFEVIKYQTVQFCRLMSHCIAI